MSANLSTPLRKQEKTQESIFEIQWKMILDKYKKISENTNETPKLTRTNISKYINLFIEGLSAEEDKLNKSDKRKIEELYIFKKQPPPEGKITLTEKISYLKNHAIEAEACKFIQNFIKNTSINTKHKNLIAALFETDIHELNNNKDPKPRKNNWLTSGKVVLGIILAIIIVLYLPGVLNTKTQISFPGDGDKINQNITLTGKLDNLEKSEVLWITLQSEYDEGLYFPQNTFINTVPGSRKWKYDFEIGIESDSGCKFSIFLSVVDTTSEKYALLKDYLTQKHKHGTEKLLFTFVDKIKVERQ